MKNFRYLIAFVLCLGVTGFARAAAIDFNMNVLDPTYVAGKTAILTTGSFAVTFHPCTYYGNSIPSSLNGDLCFEGINATETDFLNDVDTIPDNDGGVAWTSLSLTFTNPNLGSCGIFASAPAGTSSIFSTPPSTCTQVGSTYNLNFSGGQIVQGEVFLIAENGDITTTDFAGAIGTVSAATPEPASFVLLTSGTLVLGMLLFAERRRLQRNPVRS